MFNDTFMCFKYGGIITQKYIHNKLVYISICLNYWIFFEPGDSVLLGALMLVNDSFSWDYMRQNIENFA